MLFWWTSVALGASLARLQAGPAVDGSAGIGWAGSPEPAAVAGQLSAGVWTGRYDDDFAIGRHWWFGATGRLRARAARVSVAPTLEIRRGVDLLVASVQGFVSGGLVADVAGSEDARALGYTGTVGLMARYRRTRHTSLLVRLEGGVEVVAGEVKPMLAATLGLGFARPFKSPPER
ncbi:MAG: hypothetical protein AAGA48_36550 [Myxococcota bacterium]